MLLYDRNLEGPILLKQELYLEGPIRGKTVNSSRLVRIIINREKCHSMGMSRNLIVFVLALKLSAEREGDSLGNLLDCVNRVIN